MKDETKKGKKAPATGRGPSAKKVADPKNVAADADGHRKLLAVVPPEIQKVRLSKLGLSAEVMTRPWVVCPPQALSPRSKLARPYVHPLEPRSLEDLKQWVGIPNAVAELRARSSPLHPCGGGWGRGEDVCIHHLPRTKSFDFAKLDRPQRAAVHQVAQNLLFGLVDKEEAKRPPIVGVVEYLLERARGWHALVIPDLVICPGQRVELSGFPAAVFNNILIYGDGELVLRGQVKVHAFQIRRV